MRPVRDHSAVPVLKPRRATRGCVTAFNPPPLSLPLQRLPSNGSPVHRPLVASEAAKSGACEISHCQQPRCRSSASEVAGCFPLMSCLPCLVLQRVSCRRTGLCLPRRRTLSCSRRLTYPLPSRPFTVPTAGESIESADRSVALPPHSGWRHRLAFQLQSLIALLRPTRGAQIGYLPTLGRANLAPSTRCNSLSMSVGV